MSKNSGPGTTYGHICSNNEISTGHQITYDFIPGDGELLDRGGEAAAALVRLPPGEADAAITIEVRSA